MMANQKQILKLWKFYFQKLLNNSIEEDNVQIEYERLQPQMEVPTMGNLQTIFFNKNNKALGIKCCEDQVSKGSLDL